jgi:hypothetical protein
MHFANLNNDNNNLEDKREGGGGKEHKDNAGIFEVVSK